MNFVPHFRKYLILKI